MIEQGLGIGLISLIPLLAFSSEIKERIKREQNYLCDSCGTKTRLQVHHKIPQSRGGSDRRENGVALCNGCHHRWDLISLNTDVIYPGIECQMPQAREKREQKHRKKHKRPSRSQRHKRRW